MAADIDHGVDRGRAAEPLAARLVADAAVQSLLRHGIEGPVVDLARDHQDQRAGVVTTQLSSRPPASSSATDVPAILRQPSRHRAAARACADHDEVERIRHLCFPLD